MTVKQIKEELNKLPPECDDQECLLAIDHSCGFKEVDNIEVFPVERVFQKDISKLEPWDETSVYKTMDQTPIHGYWSDEKKS